jgi:hypothetical protein
MVEQASVKENSPSQEEIDAALQFMGIVPTLAGSDEENVKSVTCIYDSQTSEFMSEIFNVE